MGALSRDPPDFNRKLRLFIHLCMFSLPCIIGSPEITARKKFFVSIHASVRVAVKADRLIEGHSVFMFHVLLTDCGNLKN